jgi:hypothetical protein
MKAKTKLISAVLCGAVASAIAQDAVTPDEHFSGAGS